MAQALSGGFSVSGLRLGESASSFYQDSAG
jgi:hypothetical protein